MKTFSTILLGIGAVALSAAPVNQLKNGGFESVRNGNFSDWGYNRKIQKFHFVDSEVKHSGKYSLRLENVVKSYDAFVQFNRPIAAFKKDLLIRGWCKYENLSNARVGNSTYGMPFIGIWSNFANGRNASPSISIIKFAPGSKDWFQFEYLLKAADFQKRVAAIPADKRPAYAGFRINIANQPGKVWFDDLEVVEVEPAVFTAKLSGTMFTSENKTVTVLTESSKPVTAVLIDKAGKKLAEKQIAAGKQKCDFDISKLASGAYQIQLSAEGGKPETLKFSKSKSAFDEE